MLSQALNSGLIVGVTGAGLAVPEKMVFPFPRCVNLGRLIECFGDRGEVADFRKRRTGGFFNVKITARQRSFGPPLTSAGVTVTLSFDGRDRRDQIASCKVRRKGTSANCRR